jgi:putative glutamine amidotransferase
MKKIGITQRVVYDSFSKEVRDTIDHRWYDFGKNFNIKLFPIPNNLQSIPEYLTTLNLDGFILSGGNNIGSLQIKEFDINQLLKNDISIKRNNTEIKILSWVIEKNVPIIGVCRGMQFINSYFDGTQVLIDKKKHVNNHHLINIVDDDFRKFYGDSAEVNSYHNYGIKEAMLGEKLVPTSYSDNEIESFKHNERSIYGIMWHPERFQSFRIADINFFKKIFY